MSNLVIILGKSGSGKSTSIKTLNSDETVILNTLGKRLPFKGSLKMYNSEKGNMLNVIDSCDVYNKQEKQKSASFRNLDYCNYIIMALDSIAENKKYKNIVIDDGIYTIRDEFFNRTNEKGYEKFNEIGNHFRVLIKKCLALRDDLNVFLMLHSEPVETEGRIVTYKACTIGKMFEEKYGTSENTTILLYAQPKFDDKGNASYGFYTHTIKEAGIVIPAKTPDGMFEEDYIPNDLQLVVNQMNEYYYGE